ncbi:MAG TPA: nitronate monooxygenase [Acidimicrobiaceae bacterium]|jgi:NAD(P)H-dependent flavin oxidoreductase YrpB (nitropropane dioxygenase family)|nr:nitronate monooxygenase [Acidimicrobiaceae bacterium]
MVTTRICGRLGCTSPVFGFSWWEPDVAIAVSRAGGVGVWGCTRRTPDEIEMGLTRMKDELGDLPWGVDLVIPSGMPDTDDRAAIEAELPEEHVAFVASLREKYGVPDDGLPGYRSRFVRSEETAREQLDVVMDHRIPLLALGIGSPAWAVEQAHERGSLIVSLVGRPAHAESAIRAGADVLVAQGTDAGGHTGPIGTFSLVPQVVDIAGGRPVLAAGGVATGRHLAAALALGADGVWMGTAFLGSVEAAPGRVLLSKLIAAGSSDTVVSRSVSGKTLRMLRSAWSDEWAAADAPEPLKMPYQDILIGDMLGQILRHEVEPLVHEGAGQGVVHLTVQEPVADIMERLVREADEVLAKLGG